MKRKGMDSTLTLLVTIAIGLLTVAIILGLVMSNSTNLENFALKGVKLDLF